MQNPRQPFRLTGIKLWGGTITPLVCTHKLTRRRTCWQLPHKLTILNISSSLPKGKTPSAQVNWRGFDFFYFRKSASATPWGSAVLWWHWRCRWLPSRQRKLSKPRRRNKKPAPAGASAGFKSRAPELVKHKWPRPRHFGRYFPKRSWKRQRSQNRQKTWPTDAFCGLFILSKVVRPLPLTLLTAWVSFTNYTNYPFSPDNLAIFTKTFNWWSDFHFYLEVKTPPANSRLTGLLSLVKVCNRHSRCVD